MVVVHDPVGTQMQVWPAGVTMFVFIAVFIGMPTGMPNGVLGAVGGIDAGRVGNPGMVVPCLPKMFCR